MSEWTSVKDRLPTEEGPIVVLIADRVFVGECIKSNEWRWTYPEAGYFALGTGWIVPSHFKEPSHWMPLPPLPKE